MDLLLICLLSVLFGSAASWVLSFIAPKFGLIDYPNKRSSHREPTPKGGGVGILITFVFASLFFKIPGGFWIPATFLSLISLFGDRFDFSPKIRLPVQFVAAFALLLTMNPIQLFQTNRLILILPLSVFIVGTVNFYNFMDGINGISAITGIVAFGLLAFLYFDVEADKLFSLLSLCICLSCIGFLPFNIPKARIFMGDVGSILLGFVFASMVIVLAKNFQDFISLSSLLFPFYADELSTMAIRIRDGENLLHPHRRHLYQLLVNEKGIPHWEVSIVFGLLQLIIGVSFMWLKPLGIIVNLFLLAAYFGLFIGCSVIVRRNLYRSTSELENV